MMNKQILNKFNAASCKTISFYKLHFAFKFSTNILILKISKKWIEPNLYWWKRFHKTWAKLHKIVKIYRKFVFGGNLFLTQVTNPRKFPGNFHWEIWQKYSRFSSLLLEHCLGFGLGFPANKTFRDKMRKFLVTFCKLFHEILHFFPKINKAKTKWNFEKIFSRNAKILWKPWAAIIYCLKELVEFSALIAQYLKLYYII